MHQLEIFFLLQLQQCKELQEKVKAVAFTDSVHSLVHQKASKKFIKWMRKVRTTDKVHFICDSLVQNSFL